MQYCIWVVSPPGYVHSHVFDEIAIGLHNGILKLGFEAPIVRDVEDIVGQAIVLGCNLIPQLGVSDISKNLLIALFSRFLSRSVKPFDLVIILLRHISVSALM